MISCRVAGYNSLVCFDCSPEGYSLHLRGAGDTRRFSYHLDHITVHNRSQRGVFAEYEF